MAGISKRNEPSTVQIFIEILQYSVMKLMHVLQRFFNGVFSQATNGNLVKLSDEITELIREEASSNSFRSTVQKSLITVIIPTYNEETSIESTINSVYESCGEDGKFLEIIISDGGSTDNTVAVCRRISAPCKNCSRFHISIGGSNRSESQNIGAKDSTGNILLFLHADSILPSSWMQLVWSAMNDRKNLAGCFKFKLFLSDDVHPPNKGQSTFSNLVQHSWRELCIWAIETGTNVRSHYFSLPYGDQALFFRRSIFIGCFQGFPPTIFMEDYDLIKSIRKYGKIVTVNAYVKTSARRWEKNGFFWNTFLNQVYHTLQWCQIKILTVFYSLFPTTPCQLIIQGRFLGVPDDRLIEWYYGLTKKKVY
jgi:glycosyltransferase involved in cell wall biosynthesis